MKSLNLFLLIGFLGFSMVGLGQTGVLAVPTLIKSNNTGGGVWNVNSTWSNAGQQPGRPPLVTDDADIQGGDSITVLAGDSIRISDLYTGVDAVINVIGILTIDSLHIHNNTTFYVTGKVYILGGATLANFTNLTINNSGYVDISGNVATGANGTVIDVEGTLNIAGNLTGSSTVQGNGTVSVGGTIGSSIVNGAGQPLPIELTFFEAYHNKNAVSISWQTASEENNEYFTIERSVDGINYHTIGKVLGAGYSMSTLNYNYTDAKPINGLSYYRLTQTDYNGEFKIFHPVSVAYLNEEDINIGPNPARNFININMNSEMGNTTATIYNVNGNLVKKVELQDSLISISLEKIPVGAYMLIVNAGNANICKRFVIE